MQNFKIEGIFLFDQIKNVVYQFSDKFNLCDLMIKSKTKNYSSFVLCYLLFEFILKIEKKKPSRLSLSLYLKIINLSIYYIIV
jgi:hypothetical protein